MRSNSSISERPDCKSCAHSHDRMLPGARRAYRRFVLEGKEEGRRAEYHQGSDADSRILGDDTFIDRVLGQKQAMGARSRVSLAGVMQQVCKHYSIQEQDFGLSGRDRRISEARGVVAWLILESGVCTLAELGRITGRDISTLSSAVKRLQKRARKDLSLAATVKALLKAAFSNCNTASLTPNLFPYKPCHSDPP